MRLIKALSRGLGKANGRLEEPLEMISGGLIIVIAVFMCIEVFGRFMLEHSFPVVEELNRLLMVFAVFLAVGVIFRKGHHITVDIIITRFKRRSRLVLDLLLNIGTLAFTLFFFVAGIQGLMYAVRTAEKSIGNIPRAAILSILPVGMFFLLMAVLELLGRTIVSLRENVEVETRKEIVD